MGPMKEAISPEGGFREDPASVTKVFKIRINLVMPVPLQHSHSASQKAAL